MRNLLTVIAVLAPLSCVGTAVADESAIKLKPGGSVVENNCTTCHSPDYIQMNSPFLDEKGWTAEVTKMVKVFGADISEADEKAIIAYLTANYGKGAQ